MNLENFRKDVDEFKTLFFTSVNILRAKYYPDSYECTSYELDLDYYNQTYKNIIDVNFSIHEDDGGNLWVSFPDTIITEEGLNKYIEDRDNEILEAKKKKELKEQESVLFKLRERLKKEEKIYIKMKG